MPKLSDLELAGKPIISGNDIVSYRAETHEIELTDVAYQRIVSLKVPVMGKAFVICVDKKPIYWGSISTPISSYLFAGVTIMQPLPNMQSDTIELRLDLHNPPLYGGTDPRGNPEILQALERSGKLITTPPHSMKGYELYSWQQDGQWHFTLITGTNRNKTLEEIISPSNTVTEDGWVQIHVVSVDEIKAVLARMPQGEEVYWLSKMRGLTTASGITFAYPPAETVNALIAQAQQRGYKLITIQLQ
jgi:hypothetical protein